MVRTGFRIDGRKVIFDIDPGSTTPWHYAWRSMIGIEVLAVTATGGTVSPEQSTLNVQAIVEQLDPQRWPRLGCASSDQMLRVMAGIYFLGSRLCGAHFAVAKRHHHIRRSK